MEFAAKDLTMGQLNALVKKLGGEQECLKILKDHVSLVKKWEKNWCGEVYFQVISIRGETIKIGVLNGACCDNMKSVFNIAVDEAVDKRNWNHADKETADLIKRTFMKEDVEKMGFRQLVIPTSDGEVLIDSNTRSSSSGYAFIIP